jgi:hypothetical protein
MLLKYAWISDPFVFQGIRPQGRQSGNALRAISRTIEAESPWEGSEGRTWNLWSHLLEMSEFVIKLTIESKIAVCWQRSEQADRIAAMSSDSKRGRKQDRFLEQDSEDNDNDEDEN